MSAADLIGQVKAAMKESLDAHKAEVAEMVEDTMRKKAERAPNQVVPQAKEPEAKAFDTANHAGVVRAIKYLAKTKNDYAARELAEKDKDFAALKALGGSVLADGGALLQESVDDTFAALRQENVVLEAGPQMVDMPTGSMRLPYVGTGTSITWGAENTAVNATQPILGQLNMTAKLGSIVVPFSNELLNDSQGKNDQMIREDLFGGLGNGLDVAFLRGDGTASKPKGLMYWAQDQGGDHYVDAGGDSISNQVISNRLSDAVAVVHGDLGRLRRGVWFMSVRTFHYLKSRVGSDDFVFAKEMTQLKTLMGYPFFVTNNIPNNIGDLSTGSEIYFVDMSAVVVGMTGGIDVATSDGAYVDSNGTTVSAFSRNEQAIRINQRVDIGCRARGKEVAVITDARWTA